jgi:aspartate/methionine/tyrosine aminotransferase
VARIALCPEGAHWRLDWDELKRSLNARSRLLVVNFPNNPTGYMPSRSEFDALVELARERGLYLFCDEMYRLLEADPARRLPAMCDVYEKGISLCGLSKSFGLPGLRLGWLASQDHDVLERCMGLKDYTTICSPGPSEAMGLIALRGREKILQRNRDILARNLAAARSFFTGHDGRFRWIEPEGGPVAFPLWTGPMAVEEFCATALAQEGVMIAYGALFDHPGGHFRVGMGRRNFPEALDRLASLFMKRYSPLK